MQHVLITVTLLLLLLLFLFNKVCSYMVYNSRSRTNTCTDGASQLTLYLNFYFIKKSWECIKTPRSHIFQHTREYSISKLKLLARKKFTTRLFGYFKPGYRDFFLSRKKKNKPVSCILKIMVIKRLSFYGYTILK